MVQTFEAKARPGPIERVLTKLQPKGVDPKHGPGSGLGLKPCDYAAMAGGITHGDRLLARLAEELWQGKYLEDRMAVERMADMLHLWGAQRFALRHPKVECSGALHADLSQLAVAHWSADGEVTAAAAKSALRVGYDRWKRIEPLFNDLINRLAEAEQLLMGHLREQLRPAS